MTASVLEGVTGVAAPVVVQRALVFALDPTPSQVRQLLSHAGAARVSYNYLLAGVKANLDQRSAEKTYGLAGDDLTPSVGWSAFSLMRQWNAEKDVAAPWHSENGSRAYRTGARNLARALENFSASRRGTRTGADVGFPRFKKRGRATPSINFENGVRLDQAGNGVILPRIGRVHTHQPVGDLRGRVLAGTVKVNSGTVSYRRGRWQVSFQIAEHHTYVRPARKPSTPRVVGIDVGVKDLLVVATPNGTEVARIPAPRELHKALSRLRTLQKKADRQAGPYDLRTRRRQTASAGWRSTQEKIGHAHARVANLRGNHLHHVTTSLAKTYDVIGIEDLNVTGMLAKARPKPDPGNPGAHLPNQRAAKRGLSRAIADASFGEIRRQLTYKTGWYGAQLHTIDRFFPSSKACSGCGVAKTTLPLNKRTFSCDHCGRVTDRDLNAAINIARLTQAQHPAPATSDEGCSFVSGRDTDKPAPAHHAPARDRADEAATPPAPRGHRHHKVTAPLTRVGTSANNDEK